MFSAATVQRRPIDMLATIISIAGLLTPGSQGMMAVYRTRHTEYCWRGKNQDRGSLESKRADANCGQIECG